jgi:hypothetical protein
MAAGVGHPSGWPDLGPVYDPHASPPPNAVVSIVADSSIAKESKMSHDTLKAAIRPNSRPSTVILQGVLAELEAAADLVEQQLVHGPDAEIMAAVHRSLVEMPALLAGDLEEARLGLSTFFHEDETPDEFFVTWIRKPVGGPRYHDLAAGPFDTKAEAEMARDVIRASGRYLELADTEGGSHD